MDIMPFLSVILPSYNERRNLQRGVLREVYDFLQDYEKNWELILSDDGSEDGTLDELKKFATIDKRIQVLSNPHRGKGPTVKAGMLAASGQWRLFADFDQSTPLREVRQLLKYRMTTRFIIGSRGAEVPKEKRSLFIDINGSGF